MLKIIVDYPDREEEREIVRRNLSGQSAQPIQHVVQPDKILKARESVDQIYMDEKIESYILDLVFATRDPAKMGNGRLSALIGYGASPRASINLARAAKAHAFLQRRGFVIPEDIRSMAHDVLRHRIGLTYEAEAENITQDDIIAEILNKVQVP
jgi:MoxR-like ATPase